MNGKAFNRDWIFLGHADKKETKVTYKIYPLTYTSRANCACKIGLQCSREAAHNCYWLGIKRRLSYPKLRLTAYRLAKEVKELAVDNVGENYRCNVCGNEVTVTKAGGGTLVCCGEDMELVE